MNLFDVSGKKVIFTGATGGLGQSMAEGLLEAGAEAVPDAGGGIPGQRLEGPRPALRPGQHGGDPGLLRQGP